MSTQPNRVQALTFSFKASLFRWRRRCRDLLRQDARRWPASDELRTAPIRGRSQSDLFSLDGDHRHLTLGKVENLRVAARRLHGVVAPAGAVFSFWAQVGRPVARRGFVPGRELREGCIVPSIGGGLCQLSNALYQAALEAGLEIVERHPHSQIVPGSQAELGKDATVFWNYVDLRFRAAAPFRVEVEFDAHHLKVGIRSTASLAGNAPAGKPRPVLAMLGLDGPAPESCESCDKHSCFRHASRQAAAPPARTAFLVDHCWPEFDRWIVETRTAADRLLLPLDGRKAGKPQYAWTTAGFAGTTAHPLLTLWRALASRRLARQGAARQHALMAFRRRFAHAYVKALDYLTDHVVVTQELLPWVWESGALQGRTFDVLMTGLPMAEVHRELDRAFALHPTSATLADFRAPASFVASESAALRRARRIVTPHAQVARLFANATLLPWAVAPQPAIARGDRIVFPSSTLGRKGVYELREVARELGLRLTLAGPVLESPNFWDGVDVAPADGDWLTGAAVVVLPAWVEARPQALLRALAAGIPVIASDACGLPPQPNLTVIGAGDVDALCQALRPYACAPAARPQPENATTNPTIDCTPWQPTRPSSSTLPKSSAWTAG